MSRQSPRPGIPLLPEIGLGLMAGLICLVAITVWPTLRMPEPDQTFNLAEGILWTVLAILFFVRSHKFPAWRTLMLGTSLSFLLFGISDFIEVRTRAWYEPWSLFVLKAACVLSLLIHFILYRCRKKKRGREGSREGAKTRRW